MRRSLRAAMGLGMAALFAANLASAQTTLDDQRRMAARDLAQQGVEAYERRDYAGALEALTRAYDIVPAPSILIQIARAERELARLVEASETYRRTLRTEIDAKAPDAYRRAVHDADGELAALLPLVPRLRIVIQPASLAGASLRVTQDGLEVPTSLQGVAAPVNPGRHEIRAFASDGSSALAMVDIAEGQVRDAVLRFSPERDEAGDSQAGHSEAGHSQAAPDPAGVAPRVANEGHGNAARTWAYVGLGVGVAGLGVGAVTGVMANGHLDAAKKACPGGRCEAGSPGAQDLSSFRSLRTVSTLGYVSGAVFAAAGVTVLLLAPGSNSQHVALRVDPTGVTVAGGF